MARVGTCKDCGARFKVPEATTASQAKCSKCGGIVQIPPAEAAASSPAPASPAAVAHAPAAHVPAAATPPASAPIAKPASRSPTFPAKSASSGGAGASTKSAPSATSPAKSFPSRSAGTGSASAGGSAAASAPKASPSAAGAATRKVALGGKAAGTPGATAGKASGARAGRAKAGAHGAGSHGAGGAPAKKKLPLIPIIAGAVIVLGVGAWFMFFRGGDKPVVVAPTKADSESAGNGSEAASAAPDAATESAPAPLTVDASPTEVEPAPAVTSDPAMNLVGEAAAPAPELPDPSKVVEDRDPILAFELLPAMPGTEEQFEEWSGWIHTYFIEAPPPREAKVIKVEIDKLDPIDAAPAFINALVGLDMSDEIHVRDAFKLVEYWQDREGRLLHFNFLDATRMEQKDINSRDTVVEDWAEMWRKKMADPEKIAKFRIDVEEKIRENKSKEGG